MRDRWLIGIFLLRWGVWPVVVVVEAGLSNLNLMVWIDSLLGARLSETRLSREALELGTPIGRSRRKVEVEVDVAKFAEGGQEGRTATWWQVHCPGGVYLGRPGSTGRKKLVPQRRIY